MSRIPFLLVTQETFKILTIIKVETIVSSEGEHFNLLMKIDKNICTKLMAFTVFFIVVEKWTPNPLRPKTRFVHDFLQDSERTSKGALKEQRIQQWEDTSS